LLRGALPMGEHGDIGVLFADDLMGSADDAAAIGRGQSDHEQSGILNRSEGISVPKQACLSPEDEPVPPHSERKPTDDGNGD
jgi:hypothetical protein